MKGRNPVLPLLAALAVAVPALFAPSVLWEWRNHRAGQSVAANGTPYLESLNGPLLMHPPSMAYVVGWSIRLFGDHAWAWRLPGLCMLLLSGALVWSFVLEMELGASAAWLASTLFLTNPLVIQVALGIDFADGSILTLGVALFFWAFSLRRPWTTGRRGVVLGLCLCLCLWSKLATAFLLIGAFSLACWLQRDGRDKSRLWVTTGIVGAAAFLATWWPYCAWLRARAGAAWPSTAALMWEPFGYLLGPGAATSVSRTGLRPWALWMFSLGTYAGFLPIAVAAAQVRRWAMGAWSAGRLPRRSIIPLFALACLGLYGAFIGGGRAYPKYFQTMLISVAVLASEFLSQDGNVVREILSPRGSALLAGLTAYYALVVGDYVYTLNFDARNSALLGDPRPAELRLAAQGALYLLPALAAAAAAVRGSARLRMSSMALLGLALLGSQLGLDLAQLRGGYDLRQAYGASRRDFLEVARTVKEWPVPGPVLADRGVVDAADAVLVRGYGSSSWQDLDDIAALIARQKPKAVVYGIALNTIDELRAIRTHEKLRSLLSSDYSPRQIGSFSVWLRKRA